LEGEHDLLLDYERSLKPYERLEIDSKLLDSSSAVFVVAEVDDPNGKSIWAVVEINRYKKKFDKSKLGKAVPFRATPRKRNDELWPLIHIDYNADNNTPPHSSRWINGIQCYRLSL
jgi:hypothetical protein